MAIQNIFQEISQTKLSRTYHKLNQRFKHKSYDKIEKYYIVKLLKQKLQIDRTQDKWDNSIMIITKQYKQNIGPRFLIKFVEEQPILSQYGLNTESSSISYSYSNISSLTFSMSKNQKLETSSMKLKKKTVFAGVLMAISGK
ncbi:UNKNOWN [Stylonychia lemnae]|uniref:Uncharacterized protein n=1 Tax=Stylonychia lemnae TaxID=5949 RepID=A0A078AQK3_STYLE|nr:UNKNOWN [Stylonychia lemnae]|eukprot:CDW84715.1 UNKNOWN [Stylonychia lemnae]